MAWAEVREGRDPGRSMDDWYPIMVFPSVWADALARTAPDQATSRSAPVLSWN